MDRESGWMGRCLGPTMLAGAACWLIFFAIWLSWY
jgi:hypothetical protein